MSDNASYIMGNINNRMNDTTSSPSEMLSRTMDSVSNESRKRKLSPEATLTTSSSQSDNPNQPRVDAHRDHKPPKKKQKADLAPILEELTELETNPCSNSTLNKEDSETMTQLLSTYTKPLPVTSVPLEQLTEISIETNTDWTTVSRSPRIATLINEGVNEILDILKLEIGMMDKTIQLRPTSTATLVEETYNGFDIGTGHEETIIPVLEREEHQNGIRVANDNERPKTTAEMGVGTEDAISDMVELLKELITVLHNEKEELQKIALNSTNDLAEAKASIEALHSKHAEEKQKFEEQMIASINKSWNQHVEVLNRHKKKIIEDAKLNQSNKELLIRIKTRLKEKIQELGIEKAKLQEENQRCEMESKRLETEGKEYDKVQEKLIIKERNECWMLRKLKSQENALEAFQAEKGRWEKEREDIGIKLRRLKADLAEAKQKMTAPVELEGDPKVNDKRS